MNRGRECGYCRESGMVGIGRSAGLHKPDDDGGFSVGYLSRTRKTPLTVTPCRRTHATEARSRQSMQPPPQLVQWLRQAYPRPAVDESWLSQCYAWVIEEHDLNPATDMDGIKEHVESQLLMSDLTDSMVHGTGLPHDLAGLQKGTLSGPPIMVQIMALTEIGHSAFSLMNVRQAKIDRADLSGLARGDNEDEADEGPVPNYPRAMLRLELSDGAIKLNAIEYRKIPQLDLENTPLGYKSQNCSDTVEECVHPTRHRLPRAKEYHSQGLWRGRSRCES
ncbi:hypothetical protein F5148DRAFT_125820 [Russula earlei]|uniref:Uncharacterized protein n=1 Tax=Russula earlei TaxID=71964 RepID=A0ACC0UK20_9AGAM|nr:hypothetical protein F5148DRAFT_125820 [Russula earlei]